MSPSPPLKDTSTLSNYHLFRTTHLHLDWNIDWTKQLIHGSVTLRVKKTGLDGEGEGEGEEAKELVLDSSYLEVKAVEVEGEEVKWSKADRIGAMGEALTIHLHTSTPSEFKVQIHYSTTKDCTAVGWLTKEQTKGGEFPYLYSQCQAIHARSLLPCQDTPYIKAPYSSSIKSPIPVLMSAIRQSPKSEGPVHGGREVGREVVEYVYDQPVPIPSYLIAIAAGNLVYKAFPQKNKDKNKWTTGVWTEPEGLDEAWWEFSEDTAAYIETAEALATPYEWGVYDILLLPPSFPYGGMENTCLTFVTPTLLAHDRSLTDVCAHEISHSWSGNLIGCANWGSFWLNEGWTTYLERLILNDLHGPAERDLSYIIGRKALRDALKEMPKKYQSLVIDYEPHADPDDGFSTVPYDKGSNFLLHIERTLGGLEIMRPYIKAYVKQFSGKSITTDDWREHLYSYFKLQDGGAEYVKKLDSIDWEAWLHGSGGDLPLDMQYDQTLAKQALDLADKWEKARGSDDFSDFAPSDIKGFSASQTIVFLEKLQSNKAYPAKFISALDKTYNLNDTFNAEVRLRFYGLALASGSEYAKAAADWVVDKGRMKMCRTIYRAIYAVEPKLAQTTFQKHEGFYHPIARKMIQKDLKLR